jgi:hypothetical protein
VGAPASWGSTRRRELPGVRVHTRGVHSPGLMLGRYYFHFYGALPNLVRCDGVGLAAAGLIAVVGSVHRRVATAHRQRGERPFRSWEARTETPAGLADVAHQQEGVERWARRSTRWDLGALGRCSSASSSVKRALR